MSGDHNMYCSANKKGENVMKPVAWMWENDAWIGVNNFSEEKPSAYPNAIPLYTAPRELSDAEIEGLYYQHFVIQYTSFEDSLKFARAILKKASEK